MQAGAGRCVFDTANIAAWSRGTGTWQGTSHPANATPHPAWATWPEGDRSPGATEERACPSDARMLASAARGKTTLEDGWSARQDGGVGSGEAGAAACSPVPGVGVAESSTDKFSAGEQSLGYMYQARLALLRLLQLPEDTSVFLEKDDDLEFLDCDGAKSLASLKHKAVGDRLTDLSPDFWKSVRIWLLRYKEGGRRNSNLRFFLLTTGAVSRDSFLQKFLPDQSAALGGSDALSEAVEAALGKSASKSIGEIARGLAELSDSEKQDFLDRIQVFDGSPRIDDIPATIKDKHMRSVRREHRDFVFERLEGWWGDAVIRKLTGTRPEGLFGYEISDKMSAIAEEYKSDNLPITFRGTTPPGEVDAESDPRRFVVQLREIDVSPSRIKNAVLDYYRAFEQRSAWARENLLASGEIEDFEDRLAEEWGRYKDVVFESIDKSSAEDVLLNAGRALFQWAEMESGKYESLRIRARVTEPYVTRGGFHILANGTPEPRVYWHPRFLERLSKLLEVTK